MSLNVIPLPTVKVLDPRLSFEQKQYIVNKGASNVSWQEYPANSVSNSSINISCNPPSRDIAVSRLAMKHFTYQITITGTNTSGGFLLNDGYHAPRAYPILSSTDTEKMIIGNSTISTSDVRHNWQALLRYGFDHDTRQGVNSVSCSMLDQAQNYADLVNSNRNPLASYGENSYEDTRGGYTGYKVDPQTPGNTSATITLDVFEPIFMSPMKVGNDAQFYTSFIAIDKINYSCTFCDLRRVMSLVQGQGAPAGQINIQNISVQLTYASLLFNYLTPDPTLSEMLPKQLILPYHDIDNFTQDSNKIVQPGETITMSSQAIQVDSIPRRIYVFAKRNKADENAFTSDSFMALDTSVNALNLVWNSRDYFSGASTADIFNMCKRNGCNLSFSQFSRFVGSPICIDFGSDVGLPGNEAPGRSSKKQFKVSVQMKNVSDETINNPELVVLCVYEGTFNVVNGKTSYQTAPLTGQDVVNSPVDQSMMNKDEDIYGGNIWSSLKNILRKGHDFVKQNKLISKSLSAIPNNPYASVAADITRSLGYGRSGGGLTGGSLADLCDDEY